MSLIRKNMALTAHEAKTLKHQGFVLKFVGLGAMDKDFYDVYVWY